MSGFMNMDRGGFEQCRRCGRRCGRRCWTNWIGGAGASQHLIWPGEGVNLVEAGFCGTEA
jgi:hypothetical protein